VKWTSVIFTGTCSMATVHPYTNVKVCDSNLLNIEGQKYLSIFHLNTDIDYNLYLRSLEPDRKNLAFEPIITILLSH